MLDALFWTLILTFIVVTALVVFDGVVEVALRVKDWLEDQ